MDAADDVKLPGKTSGTVPCHAEPTIDRTRDRSTTTGAEVVECGKLGDDVRDDVGMVVEVVEVVDGANVRSGRKAGGNVFVGYGVDEDDG